MMLRRFKFLLLGGVVFWVLDACLMALSGVIPMVVLIIIKTIVIPAAMALIVRRQAGRPTLGVSLGARLFLMLAGIWLFGPVDLIVTSLLVTKTPIGFAEALFHIALFPLSTIIVALYSGTMGALVVTTVMLALVPFFFPESRS